VVSLVISNDITLVGNFKAQKKTLLKNELPKNSGYCLLSVSVYNEELSPWTLITLINNYVDIAK